MKMTKEKLLHDLTALRLDWTLTPSGCLRCANDDCPITAVANALGGDHFELNEVEEAAGRLGMDFETGDEIVDAADQTGGYAPDYMDILDDLRAELLTACGVTESEATP